MRMGATGICKKILTSHIRGVADPWLCIDVRFSPVQVEEMYLLKLKISNNIFLRKMFSARSELERGYRELSKYDSADVFCWVWQADKYPAKIIEEKRNAFYEAFGLHWDTDRLCLYRRSTRNYLGTWWLDKIPTELRFENNKIAILCARQSMQGIRFKRSLCEEHTNEDGLFNIGILSCKSGHIKEHERLRIDLVFSNISGTVLLEIRIFESQFKDESKRLSLRKVKKFRIEDDPWSIKLLDSL